MSGTAFPFMYLRDVPNVFSVHAGMAQKYCFPPPPLISPYGWLENESWQNLWYLWSPVTCWYFICGILNLTHCITRNQSQRVQWQMRSPWMRIRLRTVVAGLCWQVPFVSKKWCTLIITRLLLSYTKGYCCKGKIEADTCTWIWYLWTP